MGERTYTENMHMDNMRENRKILVKKPMILEYIKSTVVNVKHDR